MNNKDKKNVFELKRQIFHLFLGIVVVTLLLLKVLNDVIIFIIIIFGIIISFLSKKYKVPVVYSFLKNFERENELKNFPGKGIIYYFIGIFLVISFFPAGIALPSILILAFGDSASSIFGIRFGRIKHPFSNKKFLEGFIAGLIAAFAAATIFVPWNEALAGSFFAMLAESIEIKFETEQVDDNIVMPIVAAIVIWVMRFL